MKVQLSYYPFSVLAETRVSKKGNKYTFISIRQRTKDENGEKKDRYFDIIDKNDLLVMSQLFQRVYNAITDQENKEKLEEYNKTNTVDPCPESEGWVKVNDTPEQQFDDTIPF